MSARETPIFDRQQYGESMPAASETPVHTCSYSCQRPECMNAQRTELLAKLAEFASVEVPDEPECTEFYLTFSEGSDGLVLARFARTMLRAHRAQAVRMRELEAALEGLLADITEYQTINKLGGENNHWQVEARKALAGKEVK